MSTRIRCPHHEEKTASCHLYLDHYYCFGCGATGPLTNLDKSILPDVIEAVEPEDLAKSLARIDKLPTKVIRGLEFPYDSQGYYLVWPDRDYYKLRMFDSNAEAKYIGARGHKRPLLWAQKNQSTNLLLVEGEINALSLAKALDGIDIASPGGAGDFSSRRIRKLLTSIGNYSTVVVIADRDRAGTEAIINAVSELRSSGREALGILMEEDANALLERVGALGLKQHVLGKIERAVEAGSKDRSLPGR